MPCPPTQCCIVRHLMMINIDACLARISPSVARLCKLKLDCVSFALAGFGLLAWKGNLSIVLQFKCALLSHKSLHARASRYCSDPSKCRALQNGTRLQSDDIHAIAPAPI